MVAASNDLPASIRNLEHGVFKFAQRRMLLAGNEMVSADGAGAMWVSGREELC